MRDSTSLNSSFYGMYPGSSPGTLPSVAAPQSSKSHVTGAWPDASTLWEFGNLKSTIFWRVRWGDKRFQCQPTVSFCPPHSTLTSSPHSPILIAAVDTYLNQANVSPSYCLCCRNRCYLGEIFPATSYFSKLAHSELMRLLSCSGNSRWDVFVTPPCDFVFLIPRTIRWI